MRSSISAQSVASVPPAPALMLMKASESSYSPREEQARAHPLIVGLDGGVLGLHLGLEFGVARLGGQLGQLGEVVGSGDEAVPRFELVAQAVGRAQHALGLARVVPELGLGGALVERCELLGLSG